MKIIIHPCLLAALLTLVGLVAPVHAVETQTGELSAPTNRSVTFLGIEVSKISEALRSQIAIPEGTGLVIDHVAENSGAEAGGLLKYDILLKVEDQLIVNNEQLKAFIQTKAPGESVKVHILRKGGEKTLTVELGERMETESQTSGNQTSPLPPMPPLPPSFNFNMEDLQERMEELQKQAEEIGSKALRHIPEIIIEDSSTDGIKRTTIVGLGKRILISEKEGRVARMELRDGDTFFHITDKNGKVLFDGKRPSEEALAELPAVIQETITDLSSKGSFDWKSLKDVDPGDIKVILNTRKDEASLPRISDDEGA